MSKTERQLKEELEREINTINSLIRSMDDIKHGREYPFDIADD